MRPSLAQRVKSIFVVFVLQPSEIRLAAIRTYLKENVKTDSARGNVTNVNLGQCVRYTIVKCINTQVVAKREN